MTLNLVRTYEATFTREVSLTTEDIYKGYNDAAKLVASISQTCDKASPKDIAQPASMFRYHVENYCKAQANKAMRGE